MRKFQFIFILLIAFSMFGCAKEYNRKVHNYIVIKEAGLVKLNHLAGTELIRIAGNKLEKNKAIIIASFANINNLSKSSSFGRIASQQVATIFTNSGFNVIEMLLRKDVVIKQQQGEFLLSRQLQKIGTQHNAQAVLVGLYAVAETYVYVTAKLINAKNSITISSYDYKIPKVPDIQELLEENQLSDP